MKKVNSFHELPKDTDMITGIDITGNFKTLFKKPAEMMGCLFLLCTRGSCIVTIHLSTFKMNTNSMAIILPHQFFQISELSKDCRFSYIAFSQKLLQSPTLFTKTIEYTPLIFEEPVLHFESNITEIFSDYFKLLMKIQRLPRGFCNEEQTILICTQMITGIGSMYKQGDSNERARYNRNHEIVKELLRIIVENYKKERNISFYADKMHLSPQHLSTTIKKTTGRTLTDIISTFVIKDAQAKLRSTELTIQEIAYSLNFSDISFFGKYFKRYTGMSPKQYRNME